MIIGHGCAIINFQSNNIACDPDGFFKTAAFTLVYFVRAK